MQISKSLNRSQRTVCARSWGRDLSPGQRTPTWPWAPKSGETPGTGARMHGPRHLLSSRYYLSLRQGPLPTFSLARHQRLWDSCSGAILLCSFNKMYLSVHLARGPREKQLPQGRSPSLLLAQQLEGVATPLQAPPAAPRSPMDETD